MVPAINTELLIEIVAVFYIGLQAEMLRANATRRSNSAGGIVMTCSRGTIRLFCTILLLRFPLRREIEAAEQNLDLWVGDGMYKVSM
jgi:hypothetical protein